MRQYSLELDAPDGRTLVESHWFSTPMDVGDTFTYDGLTWEVTATLINQIDEPGAPRAGLQCVPNDLSS